MFARHLTTYILHERTYSSLRLISCAGSSRALHNKSQSLQSLHQQANEIDIPVPWGKIAGKLWGSSSKQPILAMHGWQDNAASFDALVPLLKDIPVLAIDLPGHGLSSWLPPGFQYTESVYLLLIKRIQRYFGWKKVKLMMHSLSAMTAYWYAALFSTDVQYVVALDCLAFPSLDVITYKSFFLNAVDIGFKLEENESVQPRYTYDELIKKGLMGYATVVSDMDEMAYKIIMSRGSTQEEDGKYIVNRDPRLRVLPFQTLYGQDHQREFARLITCPYLIIKVTDLYPEKKENFYEALEIMKTVNDHVYFKTLTAPQKLTHHFHLTHPEETAAIIQPFLEKYD